MSSNKRVEMPCPSHCPECDQYEFMDSDKGNITCPQCQTRFVIVVDPISEDTTLCYSIKVGKWEAADTRHTQPGVTFDPTMISDPGVREALCGGSTAHLPIAVAAATVIPDQPDVQRCSFCSVVVDLMSVTYGKKPYVTFGEVFGQDDDGNVTIERVKLHRQSNVAACPACSLKITPSAAREICPYCVGTKVRNGSPCQKCLQLRRGVMVPTGKVDGAVRSNNRWISPEEM